MARYKVEIPHLVWKEIIVEAENEKDAFTKAFHRISDQDLTSTDYDDEQIDPQKTGWCVYPDDSDDGSYSLQAKWFCIEPEVV